MRNTVEEKFFFLRGVLHRHRFGWFMKCRKLKPICKTNFFIAHCLLQCDDGDTGNVLLLKFRFDRLTLFLVSAVRLNCEGQRRADSARAQQDNHLSKDRRKTSHTIFL